MSNRLTVILRRGTLGTREWTHATQDEAFKRACALAELHSVTLVWEDTRYIVDASDYYSKASE